VFITLEWQTRLQLSRKELKFTVSPSENYNFEMLSLLQEFITENELPLCTSLKEDVHAVHINGVRLCL
jgi:hypothetical protein